MLHQDLEKEKADNYPTIRTILSEHYSSIAGIKNATISSVEAGEQGYGFIVSLPQDSSYPEQELFFKIEKPHAKSESAEKEAIDAHRRQKIFEFMEHVHDNVQKAFDAPKVIRSDTRAYTHHLESTIAGKPLPQDIQGSQILVMTKVSGIKVSMTAAGQQKLEDAQAKNPRDTRVTRDFSNYEAEDLTIMIQNIARMHKIGEKFLQAHDMPKSRVHGIRPYADIISDLISAFGFDPVLAKSDKVATKIAQIKQDLQQKVVTGLESITTYRNTDAGKSADELLETAKTRFIKKIASKLLESPQGDFGRLLSSAIRRNALTKAELRLGRQIYQLDQLLFLTKDSNLDEIISMSHEFAPQYQAIEQLPQSVVHHDANPTNFLYDAQSGAVTLVDYDDVAMGPRLIDIMMWYVTTPDVIFGGKKIDPTVTENIISAYDKTIRITENEAHNASAIMASIWYGSDHGLVTQLRQFTDLEKLHDSEALDKLDGSIEGTLHAFKESYRVSKELDLLPILERIRGKDRDEAMPKKTPFDSKMESQEEKTWEEKIVKQPPSERSR